MIKKIHFSDYHTTFSKTYITNSKGNHTNTIIIFMLKLCHEITRQIMEYAEFH